MTTTSTDTKHCNRCNQDKPLSEWTVNHGGYCRDCKRAYNREYNARRKAKTTPTTCTTAQLTTSTRTETRHRPKITPQRRHITPGPLAAAAGPAPKPAARPTGTNVIAPPMSEFELDFLDDYWDWDNAQIGQHLGRPAHQIQLARTEHFTD